MTDYSDSVSQTIVEPRDAMEFESHEEAYSFYKEYARSMGFGTAKLSSRRSRASKEFIDAKFSCIRYGNKQQSDDAINPRPSPKIGCKASMHVKRGKNGKWFVYSFVKDHNHELLPEQAHFFRSHRDADPLKGDRLRKRKNLALVSKLCKAYHSFDSLENCTRNPHDKGRRLVLEAGDAELFLEHLMHMQEENPKFFYAVDLNEEHKLRNIFWVNVKGMEDYTKFGDVVCIDTTYFTNKHKIPLVLFIGVNRYIQPTLFGCALIADDTVFTYVWLIQTWFIAMGERAPQVVLSDQDNALKAAVTQVLPVTRHCFSLWHVLDKIPRQLEHLNLWHDAFMVKFNKCIFRSWTEVEFEKRWWKLLDRFNLQEDEWIQLLHQDRLYWAPTFMRGISFVGLSTAARSESLNSWFDKYIHHETSMQEFIEKYKVILEDMYEEEAKADFDAWHETPELKSPSPFEKQMSLVYAHEIFKKFQIEVLGAAACHLKKENGDERVAKYTVKDIEENQNYVVEWSESRSSICCSCRSFEYKGYLCRHAIIVLQMTGCFCIPSNYIMQRWTRAALSRHGNYEKLEEVASKVRRYNDLCRRAIILGEEGSLSQESYNLALCAIKEAMKQCANVNILVARETPATGSSIVIASETDQINQSIKKSKDQSSSTKTGIRKVHMKSDHGKEKTSAENYNGNNGKETQLDPRRLSLLDGLHSTDLSEVRSVNVHTLLPSMFHNLVPGQFHGIASMHLQENQLPR
ncbi:hypothetical protein SAY87_013027 [Trapa incisa]|uniref:Protein FAR1-RELATED SEQUENCE n=1 Tax=Trapa incisa TaxID=236973 RepID=A0AAN7KEH1_9MYRT|nr:hypothetical protein SAY87_013027 [Trapa incisa]